MRRLTAVWAEDYRRFRQRDLADRDYVYVWVDGIHFNIRLEDDRLCTLVMIGVRPDGTKELVALEDGYRESTDSWATVLRDLQRPGHAGPGGGGRRRRPGLLGGRARCVAGDARTPRLVSQDGQRAGQTTEATAAKAKRTLREIMYADTRAHAEEAMDIFIAEYEAKYPKAATCLATDRERLLLRLPGGTLAARAHEQRDRITVCYGPAPAAREWRGLTHQGSADGLQAA